MVDNNLKSGKLGDFIQYKNGKALEKYFSVIGKYKVISIGNYSKNSQFLDNGVRISEKYYNEIKSLIPHRNDLTMILNDKTSSGEIIGRTLLIEKDDTYVINQRTLCMTLRVNMYAKYMYYILNSKHIRKYIFDTAKPGTQIYINAPDVLSIPIKYTENIQEQIAIAEALSDMDNLISSLQKLIDKKKSIKQGAMQELLTGKKRLTGFKKEWIHKALGEVAIIKDGTHGTFERKKDGVLLLSAKNVFNGHLVLDNESFISREDYLKIVENGFPAKEDILLSCVGTIGRCCIYTGKPTAAFQRSVAFIRTSKMCNTFLLYLLQEEVVQNKLRQSANASAQGGVYLGTLIDIDLYYPSDLKEQQAIAQVFTEMDNEIEQLKRKLFKYQQIKQGMMQELLTGHIRLIDNGKET